MSTIQGPAGNYYDKFNTTNPIARYLMNGFISAFNDLFARTTATEILEIGCGEGDMLNVMKSAREAKIQGFDVDIPTLLRARNRFPDVPLSLVDAHNIAYANQGFDLVVACEVLEHVAYPERVLAEAARMTRKHAIFSVPREPVWRVLNLARGKYIPDLGNTPGHIQHWSTASFIEQVSEYFTVLEIRQPLPWTMVLCQKR